MDDLNDLERGLIAGLLTARAISGSMGGAHRSSSECMYGMSRSFDGFSVSFPEQCSTGRTTIAAETSCAWNARAAGLVCDLLPAIEPVLQTGIDPHVLERLERMKLCTRRYMQEVREREVGVAHYRPPREKLTPVW
jgi:hypothetical protein